MAIKVNGTTVIDDSRNFTNIAGGFKTVNGTSVVGSGDISAGASTSYGAVGTYVLGYRVSTGITENNTYAGSTIEPAGIYSTSTGLSDDEVNTVTYTTKGGSSLSGTWRSMGRNNGANTLTKVRYTLYVRIS